MDESICGVNDHIVVSREVQSYNEPCQVVHYNEMICKSVFSDIKFKSGGCYRFLYLAIGDLNLKIERFVNFEDISGGLLFVSVQFTLGDCTNVCS